LHVSLSYYCDIVVECAYAIDGDPVPGSEEEYIKLQKELAAEPFHLTNLVYYSKSVRDVPHGEHFERTLSYQVLSPR
jgi:hypothetical protein